MKKNNGKGMELFINIFPFISLAVVFVGFVVLSGGRTLTLANCRKIFEQSFSLLLVGGAAVFLLAQNCLDMSVGAAIGMAGAVAALVSKTSIPLALLAALGVGLLIGAVNGFLHGVLGINAMIATLAMQFILRGLLLIVCKSGTLGIAAGMYDLDHIGLKAGVCIAFLFTAWLFFRFHSYGKKCKAAGAGEASAIQSGVNIAEVKIIGYVFMGITAGLAGFFTVIRTGAAMYNTGNMVEFDTVIALILGGMSINGGADSKFRSSVIGVLILGILNNGMVLLRLGTYPQLITKGVIFIFVLATTFTIRNKLNSGKKLA